MAKKSTSAAATRGPKEPNKKETFALGKIDRTSIVQEMETSYLDYAMSVIVQRALPDVRDGLKPVHRRILYAMWQIGLKAGAKFRKSATVVGEVLGKYHPHGDTAVYDALVRMAQDFSQRYQLVHGQGNFGSMDGDSAAAMRYTEAKLRRIAEELLYDIDKETIPFIPNFDGSQQEPSVLPAKLPNLLLNGTVGIAVGMATNIPPHNISELCRGIIRLIDSPEAGVEELMEDITGPDFPTGGRIFNVRDIKQAYATGKGSIVTRGEAEIVENKKGDFQIIISSIPFQVNKATMIEKIASLVKDKKIEGIRDLRDESDKDDSVRVVVDLKRDAYPKKILNRLFQLTQLQQTFHVNMLALVDGLQPRVLTLKMVLEEYLKHRQVVVRRRTEYDLRKAEDRAHILEGLKLALLHIDKIISTIKKSKNGEEARGNLMTKFKLTERQALAILDMRLQALAGLERLKVEQELKDKMALIKELQAILASKRRILGVIKDELKGILENYGDERRTKIVKGAVGEFSQEDLIPKEDTIILMTQDGYIKRQDPKQFKVQGRGGKGVIGLTTKEEDTVERLLSTDTHGDLLFFTTRGRVFQMKAYDVPAASRTAKGQSIVNFLQLAPHETVSALISMGDVAGAKFLVMVTHKGVMKKVDIESFTKVRRSGLIAIKLREDDRLDWVGTSTGKDHLVLVSHDGQAIRFEEGKIRAMGRGAAGVRGMKLKQEKDYISGMVIVGGGKKDNGPKLLVVMENGFGKRTALEQYKVQGRGGSGIKTANITGKTGGIVSTYLVTNDDKDNDVVIISEKGQVIRLGVKTVPIIGRATQGVRLMRFKIGGDHVASVTYLKTAAVVTEE